MCDMSPVKHWLFAHITALNKLYLQEKNLHSYQQKNHLIGLGKVGGLLKDSPLSVHLSNCID